MVDEKSEQKIENEPIIRLKSGCGMAHPFVELIRPDSTTKVCGDSWLCDGEEVISAAEESGIQTVEQAPHEEAT